MASLSGFGLWVLEGMLTVLLDQLFMPSAHFFSFQGTFFVYFE
jgi:hypothetical protein